MRLAHLWVMTCAVVLLAAVPSVAGAAVQVTGGLLTPSFDPAISDYTVRCASPVTMHVDASAGSKLSMDGHPFASGSFDTPVPLGAGEAFAWTVREGGQSTTYHARCLPSDFPSFSVERPGEPQAQWYLVAPTGSVFQARPQNYVVIFDNHGVPVWWYKDLDFRPFDARLLPNDHLVWAPGVGAGLGVYREHAFDSTAMLQTWQTSNSISDYHDLQMLPNGDVLIIGYPRRSGVDVSQFKPGKTSATVIDGEIQEVAPDGHLVWDWNSKDHIALDETSAAWWDQQNEPYDIIHMNSVEDDGDGIIFSARHLDAIYRIKKSDGSIDWKLGGSTTSMSLTVLDDPFGSYPFGGQHDARRLSDGTVTVHDNGTGSNHSPRAVRYQIDANAKTARLVESVSDPQITGSPCCGSARKLAPTADWVMSWGANSVVEEMTPANQRVFALTWGEGYFSYRAEPLLPGRLEASRLRAGMDALYPRPTPEVEAQPTGGGAGTPASTSETPASTSATAGSPAAPAAIPGPGPVARPLGVDVRRRNHRIRVGRVGRFAFILGAQDVDATGRIRFTASVPRTPMAQAGRRVTLSTRAFTSTAGRATTVRVRLSGRRRRVVLAAGRLRTTAAITAQDGAGGVARRNYRFTLLAPRR